jgi:[acyl-carrier-protein] S-malonyltransferase
LTVCAKGSYYRAGNFKLKDILMNRVFLFPGQGSQVVGMGKDLYDSFSVAREVFEEVDDALGYNLTKIIFEGDIELLTKTENTQPALMAVSVALTRVMCQQSKKDLPELCSFVAGHSLGEYSALCAAGSIALKDTAKLLSIRGRAMQESCLPGQGGMVACLGMPIAELEKIIASIGNCQIANDNSLEQIVVSGEMAAIDVLAETLKNMGKKAIKLKVSAAFHSNLMEPARLKMKEALEEVTIMKPAVPIIANILARNITDPLMIKNALIEQVTGRVRWRETMDFLADNKIAEVFEVGPGQVLASLSRRSGHDFTLIRSINGVEDIHSM